MDKLVIKQEFDKIRRGTVNTLIALDAVTGILTFLFKDNETMRIAFLLLLAASILGTVIALLLSRDRFGIHGIYKNSRNDYHRITQRLKKGITELRIIAYQGDQIIVSMRTQIEEAIGKGAKVKILIAREDSPLLREVRELEEQKSDTSITQHIFDTIEAIRTSVRNNMDDMDRAPFIEVRAFNTQIRSAITIADKDWAWWTPYFPGIRVEDSTSFELVNKGEEPIINDCIKHFDKLWELLGQKQNTGSQNSEVKS